MEPKYKIGQKIFCIIKKNNEVMINEGFISLIRAHVKFGKILDFACVYQVTGCGGTTIPEWDMFESIEDAANYMKNPSKPIPIIYY